jgi:hypothetical protein
MGGALTPTPKAKAFGALIPARKSKGMDPHTTSRPTARPCHLHPYTVDTADLISFR